MRIRIVGSTSRESRSVEPQRQPADRRAASVCAAVREKRPLPVAMRSGHRTFVTDVGVKHPRLDPGQDAPAKSCLRRGTGISAPAVTSRPAGRSSRKSGSERTTCMAATGR